MSAAFCYAQNYCCPRKTGETCFRACGTKQKIDYKDSDEAGSAPWISGTMLRGDIADDLCLACAEKTAGRKAPRKSYRKQLAAFAVYLRPFEKVLAAGHCLPFITSASRSARLVIMPSTPRSSKRHISSGSSTVHGVSSIPWPFISATSSGVSIR